MKRLMKVLGAAVVALSLSVSLVAADTASKSDPKGDTKGQPDGDAFDLKSASAGHAGSKVSHKVTSWGAAGPGGVTLELKTSNHPGGPDFMVVKSRSGGAKVLDHRGKPASGAKVTYKKLSGKSFSVALGLGFAGNPPKYRWRWRVYGENGTYDLLPNSGWVTHKVTYGDPDDEH